MNQQIGIGYSVTGQREVIQAFDSMATSAEKFHKSLDSLQSKLTGMGTGFQGIISPIKDLGGAFSSATAPAAKLKSELKALHGELQKIKSIGNIKIPNISGMPGGGPGGFTGGGGPGGGVRGQGRGWLGGGYGPAGFMGRFMAWHEAARLAGHGMVDIGMGRHRVGLDESLGKLAPLGFDKMQRQSVEESSAAFARKYGHTDQKSYIEAMTYTGSSFGNVGAANQIKMNESAILMGKAGQMGAVDAAKFQNRMLNQMLTSLPKEQYESIMHGGQANVRGFGNVDIGELSKKYMAMTMASHSTSGIFAKETMQFMSQFGPVGQAMGMKPEQALALGGVLFDTGSHAGRAGRGSKELLGGLPDALARTDLLAEGRLKRGAGGAEKRAQDDEIRHRAASIRKGFGSDLWGELEKHIKGIKTAVATSKEQGLDFRKDLGFSKDFLPIFLNMLKEGTLQRGRDQESVIKRAGERPDEQFKKTEEQIDSVGAQWKKLTAASESLYNAMSASNGPLKDFTGLLAKAASGMAEQAEQKNRVNMMKRVIDQWGTEGVDEHGNKTDKYKSPDQVKDAINRQMADVYNIGKARIDRDITGTSEADKTEKRLRTGDLWKSTTEFGNEAWRHYERSNNYFPEDKKDNFGRQEAMSQMDRGWWENTTEFGAAIKGATSALGKFVEQLGGEAKAAWAGEKIEKPDTLTAPAPAPPAAPTSITAHVKIGDREIRDVVAEVVEQKESQRRTEHQATWGDPAAF